MGLLCGSEAAGACADYCYTLDVHFAILFFTVDGRMTYLNVERFKLKGVYVFIVG